MKMLIAICLVLVSSLSNSQTLPDEYAGIYNQTYMVPYAEKFELLADFFKDNPNEPWYFWMQATIYNQMNNNEKALENYQKAIRLDPFFSGAHASLARFYYYNDSTKLDVALKHINKAIKLEPDDYHYHIDKGNIYFEMKKYEFALDEANYMLALPNFDRNLAVKLKIQVLQVQGSADELHQFVRENDLSNDGEFLGTDFALMLASIYEDMGDQTRACKLYNDASEPYNIMGEELPSEIMKNLEKCN